MLFLHMMEPSVPSCFIVKVPTSDKSLKHVNIFSHKHCSQQVCFIDGVVFGL